MWDIRFYIYIIYMFRWKYKKVANHRKTFLSEGEKKQPNKKKNQTCVLAWNHTEDISAAFASGLYSAPSIGKAP